MEEIKIGEYVRTKNGYIAKFIHVNNTLGVLEFDKTIWEKSYVPKQTISFSDLKKRVIKHSFNIIDLIEVGDYVNGAEVIWVNDHYVHCNERDTIDYTENEIKSIVTKEQFENAEYKLDN